MWDWICIQTLKELGYRIECAELYMEGLKSSQKGNEEMLISV
jgi:hypothetical protein